MMKERFHSLVAASWIVALLLATTVWLLSAPPASAEPPDWEAVADTQTVIVLTANKDGERRETTIWLIVVDG